MVGVVGDNVPSVNAGTSQAAEKHFVTPKKTPELPEQYVVLTAQGVTAEEFQRLFEWVPSGGNGQVVPGNPHKFRINRDSTPARNVVQIKVKNGGRDVDKMNVWVIWATVHRVQTGIAWYKNIEKVAKYYVPQTVEETWKFIFDIEPKTLFTSSEYPNLDAGKGTDVPGKGIKHIIQTTLDADHAILKWDVSRQMKVTIRNPAGIDRATLLGTGTH